MSARLLACPDGTREIFAFQAQRLSPIDVGNSNLAETIRNDGISMDIGALVVNLEHLRLVSIVINSHTSIANNGHATNFVGMQPTHMNMRSHTIVEAQIEVRDIMEARLEMGMSLNLDVRWFLPKHVQQY